MILEKEFTMKILRYFSLFLSIFMFFKLVHAEKKFYSLYCGPINNYYCNSEELFYEQRRQQLNRTKILPYQQRSSKKNAAKFFEYQQRRKMMMENKALKPNK
tara:strand:- start:192 stop:497 length:306 start_codon:yes stop_codon:yes gene_type:complete